MKRISTKRTVALLLCAIIALSATSCSSRLVLSDRFNHNADYITTPLKQEDTDKSSPIMTDDDSNSAISDPDDVLKNSMSISFFGSNIIHDAVNADANSRTSDGYDYSSMFDGIKDLISSSDLAFVTQETVMAGEGYAITGYPSFNAPQDLGYQLVDLGFDVVNVATEHLLDKRFDGAIAMGEWWESTFPETILTGYYNNEEEFTAQHIYTDPETDFKIAFLTYTYYNSVHVPDNAGIWIPFTADSDIKKQVNAVKDKCDVIVVSIHWGGMMSEEPNDTQRRLANMLSELGVDIIIGNHPYYMQPIETIVGENGKTTYVAYSLGQLLSGMLDPRALLSASLKFNITRDESGNVSISAPEVTPIFCHYNTEYKEFRLYKLADYSQQLVSRHGAQFQIPFSYNDLCRFVRLSVKGDLLPEQFKK